MASYLHLSCSPRNVEVAFPVLEALAPGGTPCLFIAVGDAIRGIDRVQLLVSTVDKSD